MADPENTTMTSRLFSEVFSITTILLRDCREAGLVFCRRIVVDFRQRGAREIRLPYNKVMKLQSEGLTGGGYDSYYYKVSLCAPMIYNATFQHFQRMHMFSG